MRVGISVLFVFFLSSFFAQQSSFDVVSYQLDLAINLDDKTISGSNQIEFTALDLLDSVQFQLTSNFKVSKVTDGFKELAYHFNDGVITVSLEGEVARGQQKIVTVFYSGEPQNAINPPWDGGFVWAEDSLKRPWLGVSCEGVGASTWWPTKAELGDKPDSVKINVTIPRTKDPFQVICNGQSKGRTQSDDSTTFHWLITYPITNYNVTINVGAFKHFSEQYESKSATFSLDYYVLDYHLSQAKGHFSQVPTILNSFEQMFGAYPFPEDGYGLVETSYWGMEHQGAISYGNHFKNNVLGFDFIILHESAHEYWGNAVGINDFADLWINETFATYTETLFFEIIYSKKIAFDYLKFQQTHIKNTELLVGSLGHNHHFETTDIYYKGAWVLHTIRTALHDDRKFFMILKEIQQDYKFGTITTNDILTVFEKHIVLFDVKKVFSHYLYQLGYPKLKYSIVNKKQKKLFTYKWGDVSKEFDLPVWVKVDGVIRSVKPNEKVFGDKIELLWLTNYLISSTTD